MKFSEAHDDALFILIDDAGGAGDGDQRKDDEHDQKNREECSCSIHIGSPHFESYAFDGQNSNFCARLKRSAILSSELCAPFFGADFDKAAIARRDALGDDSRAADYGIDIRWLSFDLQFCFEPSAEKREIQKRENRCRKQADVRGTKN